ncbi:MAG: LodA/GoxA family CTQ-dependent oxidase [Actinomycetota bacterium]
MTELDHGVIGNLAGVPFSPGIETTWIVRSPLLYSSPYNIAVAHFEGSNAALASYYAEHGLSLTSDPQDEDGSEPGDLTKRMANPWQSDFYDCPLQTPNVSDPAVNQSSADDGVQIPPTYYRLLVAAAEPYARDRWGPGPGQPGPGRLQLQSLERAVDSLRDPGPGRC